MSVSLSSYNTAWHIVGAHPVEWNPMDGMKWKRMGEMGWTRGNGMNRVEWNEWNRIELAELKSGFWCPCFHLMV